MNIYAALFRGINVGGSSILPMKDLAATPESPDLDLIEALRADTEGFALKDDVAYLHAPDGIGRSKLAARMERALGVVATGRNWRTVGKILEMARSD